MDDDEIMVPIVDIDLSGEDHDAGPKVALDMIRAFDKSLREHDACPDCAALEALSLIGAVVLGPHTPEARKECLEALCESVENIVAKSQTQTQTRH